MPEKRELKDKLVIIFLLFVLISIFSSFLLIKPQITGLVVYGEESSIKNWSFSNTNDYVYDDSIVVDGDGRLAPIITYTYWNTTTETDYEITAALYNPNDKTNKVNGLDNDKHEINKEKIFDLFFEENLENGDIISLYMNSGSSTDIYLCDKGIVCDFPGYGSVSYDGEEGWYNITIIGLGSSSNVLNLVSLKKVKINFINSTKGVVTKALYNPSDKTSKIQDLDNDRFEVNKAKLFNLIFDNQIDNEDVVSIYVKSGSASEIYLCGYGAECDNPGYGSVNYSGEEGWHNITVNGLDSATNSFNLDPEKLEIDYIKAVHRDYEEHSSSNTTYPSSAEIETDDLEVTNLKSFDMLSKNGLLNNQNINYQYSTDSGSNWNAIPENSNLSGVNTTNGKIRIKAVLSSDGIDTPVLYDMAVSYSTQIIICSENWAAVYGSCLVNDAKLKTYTDSNNCGTNDNFPADNGSYVSCDYCSPDWSCISHSGCQLNNVKKCIAVEDNNSCYNLTNLSSDTYSGDYNEFNLSCAYNKTGSGFSNLSISIIANEKLIINETVSTDTIVELNVSNALENNFISIIKYSENKKNTSPSLSALGKYLDIEADNSLKNSINSVRVRIYYSDEEINNASLEEETLKIYYYNETSNVWQELNSTVNATENYVLVEIEHLSTYGLFGEQKSSPDSGGSSGGGHSSTRIIKKTPEKEETPASVKEEGKKTIPKTVSKVEEKAVCEYDLDISLPDDISFVEKDFIKGQIKNQGNCNISEVKIDTSQNLTDIIDVPVFIIGNLEKNGVVDFILNKKSGENKTSLLVQGFNIFRAKKIKNYKGDLLINIIKDNNIKKEIKKSINVEVSVREDIKNKLPLFFMMFIIVFIVLFGIYKKTKIIK